MKPNDRLRRGRLLIWVAIPWSALASAQIIVDWRNTGAQDGTSAHPYQRVQQAEQAARPEDELSIRAGSYGLQEKPAIFSKPGTIAAESGLDVIGGVQSAPRQASYPRYDEVY